MHLTNFINTYVLMVMGAFAIAIPQTATTSDPQAIISEWDDSIKQATNLLNNLSPIPLPSPPTSKPFFQTQKPKQIPTVSTINSSSPSQAPNPMLKDTISSKAHLAGSMRS
ncbi:uncharacterized protein EAE97_001766 [Botrytis byssoidea]|uniref:Uncharacterized protein n=1 Tax=Botrytis byssoidea TaxID=139641 RepID=A0A9P5IYS0_9HELO|nr:uncharacterized protein EAE97_001766 [Botrytis byssoidea]KAF7952269.1 hypothetical protein EAE97_001766 [Botrytis byssoidea]